jgi:hydrogenase expression/formation protein HypC
VFRDVSLFMLQDELPREGDFVMVHVGYAIQKIEEAEARSAWVLFDEILQELGGESLEPAAPETPAGA